jgi:ribosomal protein S18 acetylase RimI-like enzyme
MMATNESVSGQSRNAPESKLFAKYSPRPADQPREPIPEELLHRPGSPKDLEALSRLISQRESIDLSIAADRVGCWFKLSPDTNLLLVAENAERAIGYGRAGFFAASEQDGHEPAPAGWYLSGLIVDEKFRRRGIGELLTRERLAWIFQRAGEAYYFTNSLNTASIDLHRRLGFEEIQRNVSFPGAHFSGGGIGVLYRMRNSNPPPVS